MYIIRTAFWLSVVILLLPADVGDQAQGNEPSANAQVSATDTIGAALSAAGDIAGLCSRQPDVCETGSAAWQTFQSKARYGAELLYDWAAGEDTPADAAAPDSEVKRMQTSARNGGVTSRIFSMSENTAPIHTGSTMVPANGDKRQKSQNTLGIEDLIPQWEGPSASPKA